MKRDLLERSTTGDIGFKNLMRTIFIHSFRLFL